MASPPSTIALPPAASMTTTSEDTASTTTTAAPPLPSPLSPPHVPIPRRGVNYRSAIVLAPMVRSGELPSRLLALHYGASLVWGPETIDRALIGCTRKINLHTGTIDYCRYPSNHTNQSKKKPRISEQQQQEQEQKESVIYRIHPGKEQGKLIYQMGTATPELAVQAGKMIAADVAGIDVNSGCPKPFSTAGGMGAALLKDPERLCAILRALVNEVGKEFEIGISVKIRLLETAEKTRALAEQLVKTGITGLTVHCRTTPMRPRERAIREQLRMVGEVCRAAGVACLMNGDVTSRDEGEILAGEYGVDGAMIATAAEANMSVFRTEKEGGKARWEEVAERYLRIALDVENKYGNTKFMLAQIVSGKSEVGKKLQKARGYVMAVEALGLEEELGSRAKEVDARLGIMETLEKDRREKEAKSKGVEKAMKENESARAAGRHVAKMKEREEGLGSRLAQRGVELATAPAAVSV